MKKGTIIVLFISILIIFIAVIQTYFFTGDNVQEQYGSFPTSEGNYQELGKPDSVIDFQILVATNTAIYMHDPRSFPGTKKLGSGMYTITNLEDWTTQSFNIIFNESNNSFAIGLTKEPLALSRKEAEEYLQKKLNISEQEMCVLNIYVGVPYAVNPFFSGENLGLSFCEGSVTLE